MVRLILVAAATSLAVVSLSASAQAQGDQPREPTPAFRSFSLSVNPVSLFVLQRYGVNIEFLPAEHHALVLNPYYSSFSLGTNDAETTYTQYGGEVGYHYYSGTKGANGLFAGPSVLYTKTTVKCTGCSSSGDFSYYGVAGDVGYQWIFKPGFTMGVGGGLMYINATAGASDSDGFVRFSGVIPRFLFKVGWSF
jgi:hypothetical protein